MLNMPLVVFWIQVAATWYMVGVILLVQIVHYPLMRHVSPAGFSVFEKAHVAGMGLVVAPAMILELLTAILFCINPPQAVPAWVPVVGLVLVGLLWLSTWALSVPCHRKLEKGWDETAHRRLVLTNWPRTALWLARGGLLLWVLIFCVAMP